MLDLCAIDKFLGDETSNGKVTISCQEHIQKRPKRGLRRRRAFFTLSSYAQLWQVLLLTGETLPHLFPLYQLYQLYQTTNTESLDTASTPLFAVTATLVLLLVLMRRTCTGSTCLRSELTGAIQPSLRNLDQHLTIFWRTR